MQGGGAGSQFSVFFVDAKVAISGLTISGGDSIATGGGIHNVGTLTLNDCAIVGNTAFARGGGIDSDTTLTLTNCTVAGNFAPSGGGLWINGTMTMTNTTVSGNLAQTGGGIGSFGSLTVTNSTVAGNSITAAGGGGGIESILVLTVNNSIVAGNLYNATGLPDDLYLGGSIGFPSRDNLIRAISGFALLADGVNQNRVGITNPGLGPLQDNGGPTQTMALRVGSPAIDAGSNALIPVGKTTDQRGLPRIFNGAVDIGAFESSYIPQNPWSTRRSISSIPMTAKPACTRRSHSPMPTAAQSDSIRSYSQPEPRQSFSSGPIQGTATFSCSQTSPSSALELMRSGYWAEPRRASISATSRYFPAFMRRSRGLRSRARRVTTVPEFSFTQGGRRP